MAISNETPYNYYESLIPREKWVECVAAGNAAFNAPDCRDQYEAFQNVVYDMSKQIAEKGATRSSCY